MAGRRYYLVLSTAPPGKADFLADKIVAIRLAACVSVLPGILSHYVWKDKKEKSRESMLV
ncbi:MAG: divalent cation tolerance protein CutA, partial [Elusimicrobia bacterium]|nr:divalent cation tolerance protein CutA [Elusimicrobiota bacterium]